LTAIAPTPSKRAAGRGRDRSADFGPSCRTFAKPGNEQHAGQDAAEAGAVAGLSTEAKVINALTDALLEIEVVGKYGRGPDRDRDGFG
jgi:hypothetical protein